MARRIKGTLFRRGQVYWCKFKHQGVLYRFSLATAKKSHALHECDRLMTLRRAAIIDGTFNQKFAAGCGETALIRGRDLPLGLAWQRYIACRTRPQSGDSTLRQYGFQFTEFVEWMCAEHPEVPFVSGVTKDMANMFLHHLETRKQVAPGTFNKYVDTLRRTFRVLKEEADAVSENPWVGIRHKRKAVNRRNPFTPDEVKLILERSSGWMRTLFCLGFYTGQRLVDCCLIRWEQMDLANNLVELIPMKTRNSSGLRVELPMHPDLRRHLDDIRASQGGSVSGFVLPEGAAKYRRDPAAVSVAIREFLTSCGLRVHKEGTGGASGVRAVPELGFHSCRHTFVTVCRNAGVPDSVVQSIVGDSYRLYSHVDRESKQRAIDQIPSLSSVEGEGQTREPGIPPVIDLDDAGLERMLDRLQAEVERRGLDLRKTQVA